MVSEFPAAAAAAESSGGRAGAGARLVAAEPARGPGRGAALVPVDLLLCTLPPLVPSHLHLILHHRFL